MKKIIFAVAVVLIVALGASFYGAQKAKESYDRGVARLTNKTVPLMFFELKTNALESSYDKGLFSSRAVLKFEITDGNDPVQFEAKTTIKHGFAEIFSGYKAHSDVKVLTPTAADEVRKVFGTDEFLSVDVLINMDKTRDVTLNLADIKVDEGGVLAASKPFAKMQIMEDKLKSLEIGVGKLSGSERGGKEKIELENASALIELSDFKGIDELAGFLNIKSAYESIAKVGMKVGKFSVEGGTDRDLPKDVKASDFAFVTQIKPNGELIDTVVAAALGSLEVDGKKALLALDAKIKEKNVNKDSLVLHAIDPKFAAFSKILMSKNYILDVENFSFKNPSGKEIKFKGTADASALGASGKKLEADSDFEEALKAVKFDGELKVQAASISEFLSAYKGIMPDKDFNEMMEGVKPFEERINSLFVKSGEYMSAKFRHDAGSEDFTINDKISLKEFVMSLAAQ